MNDDAASAYYQANKDRDDDWDETPSPGGRSEKRRLQSMVSVRFSPDEIDRVREAAAATGMSLSGFLRDAALARAEGRTQPHGSPAEAHAAAEYSSSTAASPPADGSRVVTTYVSVVQSSTAAAYSQNYDVSTHAA